MGPISMPTFMTFASALRKGVELAFDLEDDEMVQSLLQMGAGTNLGYPIWRFHHCPPQGQSREKRARHTSITASQEEVTSAAK